MAGYRELPAAPPLDASVDCYWVRSGRLERGVRVVNRILPDGCMDIIINLGDPVLSDGGSDTRTAFVVGAMTSARRVFLRGRVDTIGIRFRPGMAPAYLGEDANRLTDAVADLDALWRPAFARELVERLGNCPADEERAGILDAVLTPLRPARRDAAIEAAVRAIRESRGAVTIAVLSCRVGLSPRQLQRRFAERVGLSPKLAARIARFGHAASLLRERRWTGARVAAAAGYHDQPHMTRDFHALAGLSPSAYLAERVASVQDAASEAA